MKKDIERIMGILFGFFVGGLLVGFVAALGAAHNPAGELMVCGSMAIGGVFGAIVAYNLIDL
jgi:hypothetical protein